MKRSSAGRRRQVRRVITEMEHRTDTDSIAAESVRAACLNAAIQAYEDAGIRGLCADGRWEAALAAIRQLDLSVLEPPAVD
jgi:hypothetical protein